MPGSLLNNPLLDIFEREIKVGDYVAYSRPSGHSSRLAVGTILKITDKGVSIRPMVSSGYGYSVIYTHKETGKKIYFLDLDQYSLPETGGWKIDGTFYKSYAQAYGAYCSKYGTSVGFGKTHVERQYDDSVVVGVTSSIHKTRENLLLLDKDIWGFLEENN